MKKRFIVIPLLFAASVIAVMKLIWDSLPNDAEPSRRPYNTLKLRVRSILKKNAENKLFTAEKLLELLGEPRDILEGCYGLSAEEVLENYRLEIAEKLLRTTDDTISCIAETAGFGDSAAMFRPFKRVFNTEPAQYRESFRS